MKIDRLMPLLVLALLPALPRVLPNHTVSDPEGSTRRVAVAAAITAVPYRVGAWVGTDEWFAPAAQELLHPNAILSRRYERIGSGASASLLLFGVGELVVASQPPAGSDDYGIPRNCILKPWIHRITRTASTASLFAKKHP